MLLAAMLMLGVVFIVGDDIIGYFDESEAWVAIGFYCVTVLVWLLWALNFLYDWFVPVKGWVWRRRRWK